MKQPGSCTFLSAVLRLQCPWWATAARAGGSQHWANHHSGDGGPASPLSSPLQMVLKLTYTYQVPVCPSGEKKKKV